MTKAIACVFYNYTYDNPYFSIIIWEYFKKELKLWQGTFDKLYLVDNNFGFTQEDEEYMKKLGINYLITRTHNMTACQNITMMVKDTVEDALLLIHPDTLIYDPAVISGGFKALDEYNTVAIFDGSGKPLANKFPIMAENKYRTERARFCNYLWFQRMEDFRAIPDLDFEPVGKFGDYIEAASYVTEQLLERGVRVKELRDDRSNILMEINPFKVTKVQWSDPPTKEWGKDCPLELGYYHVRNSNGGAELVNEFQNIRYSYERRKKTMPLTEITRLLAWYQLMGDVVEKPLAISAVISDLGIKIEDWDTYIQEFYNFHNYVFI